MLQKIIIIVALTCLIGCTSSHLTKEVVQPNPELDQRVTADEHLLNSILELFVQNPQQIINNVAELLSNNPKPPVSDLLDAINGGVGSKVLVIDNEQVQLDPVAFEAVALQTARKVAKVVYPKNYFEQIVFTSMIQQHIKSAFKVAEPIIAQQKIPVQVFEIALRNSGSSVAQRALVVVQQRDILTDALTMVQVTVCETLVQTLTQTINSTLTQVETFLNSIDVTTGESNLLTNLLSTVVDLVLVVVNDTLGSVNTLLADVSSTLCSNLLNSTSSSDDSTRKRRDVDTLLKEVSLVEAPENRALATRGILDTLGSLIWSILSPVLNALATSLVASYITQLTAYVDTIITNLGDVLYTLIDSLL